MHFFGEKKGAEEKGKILGVICFALGDRNYFKRQHLKATCSEKVVKIDSDTESILDEIKIREYKLWIMSN